MASMTPFSIDRVAYWRLMLIDCLVLLVSILGLYSRDLNSRTRGRCTSYAVNQRTPNNIIYAKSFNHDQSSLTVNTHLFGSDYFLSGFLLLRLLPRTGLLLRHPLCNKITRGLYTTRSKHPWGRDDWVWKLFCPAYSRSILAPDRRKFVEDPATKINL